ncbi:unnamed protein product [Adineta ricciae]|nr:unnamed protein product [Adineta ricciae]
MAHAASSHVPLQRWRRTEWLYKSNTDPWSSEAAQWSCYSDVEAAMIEEAFQKKASEALLDSYHVDFKHFVQISNDDFNKQRPVKRLHGRENEVRLREGRFFSSIISPATAFVESTNVSNFNDMVRNHFNCKSFMDCYRTNGCFWIERAVEGLVIEGKKMGRQQEAEWMAQQLLNVKGESEEKALAVCVRLYTMETFLYKKINEFLRLLGEDAHIDFVRSKVPTFGPFIHLFHSLLGRNKEKLTVYRGANLSNQLIEQFKRSIGKKQWLFPAFTSTSRSVSLAEQFGNVLFEIDINYLGTDISEYSFYPEEEEVLLRNGFWFQIDSCSFDAKKAKWIIHLSEGLVVRVVDAIRPTNK